MAKKRTPSSNSNRSRSRTQPGSQNSSSIQTNSFIKGMNKDITPSLENNQSWWHARNIVNNSEDGDLGIVGNEPSNLQCGVIPYTIIGAIHRYGDEWIIYSTDDTNSEIGTFDDSECKYTTLVNDPCLNFNRKYLITGAAKENFDCTWQVYWDDGNNPSRALNIDEIPWKKYISSAEGDPCIVYSDIEPRRLDCEQIRLAPLVDTPCIVLSKATDGGMLRNGAYQAFIAYTENETKVTDYIGISNIQTLWSHEGTGGSLDISVSNLDTDYEYYELVILRRNQGQTSAKKLGYYNTQQKNINIDFIAEDLEAVDLLQIPLRSPAYEKSESMFVVNDWLIRQGPTEQFDFNYQPDANNIKVNWVINSVQNNYYALGGNKMNFLRDEQYAFFIRWIYNTGERSSSYHIPGRAPENYLLPNGTTELENEDIFGSNVLDPSGDPLFKVYNTASITSTASEPLGDGTNITARGKMGYWESTELYPSTRPDIWGDLCGKPIRHHKMPDESIGSALNISNTSGDLINILGVEFTNIARPKYNDGTFIQNIVGYEILKGSRLGAKSILAKGIFKNMRKYTIPDSQDLIGSGVQGLYPNYPYNDLRPDVYFHDGLNANSLNRTDGCDNFKQSCETFLPLGDRVDVNGEPSGYSRKVFTFHSPDLMFTRPYLNAYETKIYGDISGTSSGFFKPSEDHPQYKLLRNGGALVAAIIGFGYACHKLKGTTSRKQTNTSGNLTSQSGEGKQIDGDPRSGGRISGGGGGIGSTWTITGFTQTGGAIRGGDWKQPWASKQTQYRGGALAAGAAAASTSVALDVLLDTIGGIGDLYTGGAITLATESAKTIAEGAEAGRVGVNSGILETTRDRDTSESNLPQIFRTLTSIFTLQANIAIGGNEIIDLFYNMINRSDFVWKYNSVGFYSDFSNQTNGLWRIKNTSSNYIGGSFQTFDSGNYKINNLYRPETVAVSLDSPLRDPLVIDESRYVIGGDMSLNLNADGEFTNQNQSVINEFSDGYLLDPTQSRKTNISAKYGALKFNFDNQYGQLAGIKQIQLRGCVELLDSNKPDEFLYTSSPIFAGDTFICRYTEKVIMPIFSNYLLGQPDDFTFDYSLYVNIPYPRFWMNTQRYDITPLASEIASLGAVSTSDLDALMPNDLFYLDRGNDSCSTGLAAIFNSSDPNPTFNMEYAYSYSHVNGITDFFVETEINLTQRDWEDEPSKRIYSVYDYNDVDELFHAQIQKKGNFYKYDESLSPSKFPTQLSSFGQVQPLTYDPLVAENCYVSYPKRLIYSLQAQEESRKDFWRVFLNYNYKDFKNDVSVIKPINKSGALIFFPHLSPQMFQGLDTLKTQLDTKLTIGDGGLFSQPFQNVANADISNEYGSCESIRGVINTPIGLFFISQAQGKIFQYGGKGLEPISNAGMKWWFAKYLPSRFIKQFPNSESSVWTDNPVHGVGCQVMYDSVDDIVYFMKKDYQLKPEFIAGSTFIDRNAKPVEILTNQKIRIPVDIGDPVYFDDCSWTISYDPKVKAWISFHDWHPELALPSINHFFTTKTVTTNIAQCPPGYNYNPVNGLCEIAVNITSDATVLVEEITENVVSGGPVNCLVDVVLAMDTSGSTDRQGRRQAQLALLNGFLADPQIQTLLSNQQMQIGFTQWGIGSQTVPLNNGWAMASTQPLVNPQSIDNWYDANWGSYGDTQVVPGLNGAVSVLNAANNSELGDRSGNPNYRRVILFVTDTTTDPGVVGGPYQSSTVGNGFGPANQFLYAIFCGANDSSPDDANVLDHISMTPGPVNVDPYQFGIDASDPTTITPVATAIGGAVCGTAYSCDCPTGYTLVYPDPATSTYSSPTGECTDIPGEAPICRRVTCECPPATIPGTVVTELGTCPDSSPGIFNIGDPNWVDPDPRRCNYFFYESAPANFEVGGFWRHNVRCDSFVNFYNTDYPWEIDLISNTGQAVNTVRSFEYQLETYVYKGDPQYNMCGGDKWEDLDFNFDAAIVYNNDQVSGLLSLNIAEFNNPWGNLQYPSIAGNTIDIEVSKVEHKFRFNQFWDITNDRGEFTNAEQSIFNTDCNGYIRPLNPINLNYQKSPTERKKFRHYSNHVILRKNVSANRKMLLRLNNTKLQLSMR